MSELEQSLGAALLGKIKTIVIIIIIIVSLTLRTLFVTCTGVSTGVVTELNEYSEVSAHDAENKSLTDTLSISNLLGK